jgi:hypothetical protein
MTRSTITPHRRAGSRPGDEGHRVTRCRGFGVSRFRGGRIIPPRWRRALGFMRGVAVALCSWMSRVAPCPSICGPTRQPRIDELLFRVYFCDSDHCCSFVIDTSLPPFSRLLALEVPPRRRPRTDESLVLLARERSRGDWSLAKAATPSGSL